MYQELQQQDAIPGILGVEQDGLPWAEYWLGTHPNGPATLEDGRPLSDLLVATPECLGEATRTSFGGRLPFMVKLLSASSPLSLQAHPSREQAVVGYGGADKHQVMEMTRRILKMEKVARPDDAADAIAIALCHARSSTSLLAQKGYR